MIAKVIAHAPTRAEAIVKMQSALDEFIIDGIRTNIPLHKALLREPDLVNRLRSREATGSTCIHCNRCMPTIYTGTRCILDHPAPLNGAIG